MKKFIIIFSLIIITLFSGCDKKEVFCIHIIDVGQADCILIKTIDNKTMLIDGGDEDSSRIIKNYLKNKHIKNLDIIVATHPDSDHIGSLDYVIDNFDVKNIYMTKKKSDSECYDNLISACKNNNLNIKYLSKGDSFKLDKFTAVNVLSPDYISEDNNSNSIVLNISYKNNSFLFTGDCDKDNENEILDTYNLGEIDFLKVAHHGSNTSSSLDFLKKISPDIAVISCGYKNSYGHPHEETIDNLKSIKAKIFRTDVNGSMVFYSDGDNIYSTVKYKYE